MAERLPHLPPHSRSNELLAIQFLQGFGSKVPLSIEQAGYGFYDSFILYGLKLVHVDIGRLVCSLIVPLRFCNSKAIVHGGVIASLVDVVGSAAIMATGVEHSGVSVEINVSYLSSAAVGEEIEIDARTLRVGKNTAVVSVDIKKKSTDELIAQGRHTKYLAIPKNIATSKL